MFSEWWSLLTHYATDLATAPAMKFFLSAVVAVVAKLLGLPNPAIQALLTLMLFDYIMGAASAWKRNELEFSKLKRGLGKFIVYALAINIAWLADEGMDTESMGYSLRNLLCGYLCANESLSSLTHLAGFGVPIPTWLMQRLRKYRDSVSHDAEYQARIKGDSHNEK